MEFAGDGVYVLAIAGEEFLESTVVDLAVRVDELLDETLVLIQELLGAMELVVGALESQIEIRVVPVEHQADRPGQLSVSGSLVLDPLDVVPLLLAAQERLHLPLVGAQLALGDHVDNHDRAGDREHRPAGSDRSAGRHRLQDGLCRDTRPVAGEASETRGPNCLDQLGPLGEHDTIESGVGRVQSLNDLDHRLLGRSVDRQCMKLRDLYFGNWTVLDGDRNRGLFKCFPNSHVRGVDDAKHLLRHKHACRRVPRGHLSLGDLGVVLVLWLAWRSVLGESPEQRGSHQHRDDCSDDQQGLHVPQGIRTQRQSEDGGVFPAAHAAGCARVAFRLVYRRASPIAPRRTCLPASTQTDDEPVGFLTIEL